MLLAKQGGSLNSAKQIAPGWDNQPGVFAINNLHSATALKTATVCISVYKAPQIVSYCKMIGCKFQNDSDVIVNLTWDPARKYANASAEVKDGIGTVQQPLSSVDTAHLWPMGNTLYAISNVFKRSQCRNIGNRVQAFDSQTNLIFVSRVENPYYLDYRTNEDGCYTSTNWHGRHHCIFLAPNCVFTRVIKPKLFTRQDYITSRFARTMTILGPSFGRTFKAAKNTVSN